MKYATIRTTSDYQNLKEIAELLGYTTKKDADVGSPYFPLLIVKGKNVKIVHGAKFMERKKNLDKEKYEELKSFEIIKYMIQNSPKIKK